MKIKSLILSSILLVGCANQPNSAHCELSQEETTTLRVKVRDFLRAELGDLYTYYDTEDSILRVFVDGDGACGILIYPAGDSEDGSSLPHGDGVVLFDRESLEPTDFQTFVY